MIVTSMNLSEYNFQRCKLCGEMTAEPLYDLTDGIIYSCQRCDFHFLNRLDSQSEKNQTSTPLNDKTRRYIESRLNESAHLHPARIQLTQEYIKLHSINTLDIGAGLGQFQLLLKAEGVNGEGIEPSGIRREYAREKFNIDLQEKLVDDPYWQLNFRNHFDLITLWDVIEHVDFPRETLQSAIKLLKPGGFLFLETPSRDVLSYKASQLLYRLCSGKTSLFLPNFYSTGRYGHKQIFTHEQITDLLKRLGLEIICSKHSYPTRLLRGDKMILIARKTR